MLSFEQKKSQVVARVNEVKDVAKGLEKDAIVPVDSMFSSKKVGLQDIKSELYYMKGNDLSSDLTIVIDALRRTKVPRYVHLSQYLSGVVGPSYNLGVKMKYDELNAVANLYDKHPTDEQILTTYKHIKDIRKKYRRIKKETSKELRKLKNVKTLVENGWISRVSKQLRDKFDYYSNFHHLHSMAEKKLKKANPYYSGSDRRSYIERIIKQTEPTAKELSEFFDKEVIGLGFLTDEFVAKKMR